MRLTRIARLADAPSCPNLSAWSLRLAQACDRTLVLESELALVVVRQQGPLPAQTLWGGLGETGAGKGSVL